MSLRAPWPRMIAQRGLASRLAGSPTMAETLPPLDSGIDTTPSSKLALWLIRTDSSEGPRMPSWLAGSDHDRCSARDAGRSQSENRAIIGKAGAGHGREPQAFEDP